MFGFGSSGNNDPFSVRSSLPQLTDDPKYKSFMERHNKIAFDLNAVRTQKDAIDQMLASFGHTRSLSDIEFEALKITTSGMSPELEEHRRLVERSRELSRHEKVLAKALEQMQGDMSAVREQAQVRLSKGVFVKTWSPAVCHAARALLTGVLYMYKLKKVQHEIGCADLLVGPNNPMPLPAMELEGRLNPFGIIQDLENMGHLSAKEARELRSEFSAVM